jgi:hypothetical protein
MAKTTSWEQLEGIEPVVGTHGRVDQLRRWHRTRTSEAVGLHEKSPWGLLSQKLGCQPSGAWAASVAQGGGGRGRQECGCMLK